MKILLVYPPFPDSIDQDTSNEDVFHPPLSITYLSSVLNNTSHNAEIFDMPINNYSRKDLVKKVKRNDYDAVGFTATTSAFPKAVKCANRIKELGDIKTIVGGSHVTFRPKKSLKNSPSLDVVVRGEGEITLKKLLDGFENSDISNVKGITYRINNSLVNNVDREYIKNLDELPFPDFEKLPIKKYVDIESLGTMTSRGCPYNCTFCSSAKMWGPKARMRSVNNVMKEVEQIIGKYNYSGKEFWFYDDAFTLNKNRVRKICNEFKTRNINLRWKCLGRVNSVNKKLLKKMKEAGCFRIAFGIESGSKRTLERINKHITLKEAKKAVKNANEVGLEVETYFIIGFPWETKKDFKKTINFINNLDNHDPALGILTPHPGTEVREEIETKDIKISDDWSRYTNDKLVYDPEKFTEKELKNAKMDYITSMASDLDL